MIIITGTIKVESEAELLRVKDTLVRRAVKSRADAGNIDYVFTQNLEDPSEIRLVEKWESDAALNAHLEIPDEEFNAVIGSAKLTGAVVTAVEAGEERVLMQR